MTLRLAALIGALFIVFADVAKAQDRTINAFFGNFRGTGVAENRDSIYFGVTVRDFDVTIAPLEGNQGFEVRWSTVIRRGGDPANPKVRSKGQQMAFVPDPAKPGVFRSTASGDPLSGAPYAWSRIDGDSLQTYIFTVDDDGAYQVQRYTRTLTPTGMELIFQRIRDNDEIRTVKGKLIRY